MGKYDKLLIRLLSGASDSSIAFDDLRQLLIRFGFNERIRGSHHIYTKVEREEILNFSPSGSNAKPYQVKQVRAVIVRYKLGVTDVE